MTLYLGPVPGCVKTFPRLPPEGRSVSGKIARSPRPGGVNSPRPAEPSRPSYGFGGVLLKSTVGAAAAPGAASKYVRAFAPVTLAVSACGKVRMYVL